MSETDSTATDLSPSWVINEVGKAHIDFVIDFIIEHLGYLPSKDELNFRIAPSMIARSECELFTVSAPRFAVRVTLPDRSYLNLRRLTFLCDACDDIIIDSTAQEKLSDVLRLNKRIPGAAFGDSVLIPNYEQYDRGEWFILTTNLGRRYGEVHYPDDGEVCGTPFLHQMKAAGGMCAQAACFMANALMLEHARGLFAVAEITALSSPEVRRGKSSDILIGGMTYRSMRSFLASSEVNLRGAVQSSTGLPTMPGLQLPHFKMQLQLSAIRSYLLSGFPVILHFDYRAFANTDAYEKIRHLLSGKHTTLHHAVVFVGCCLAPHTEFLINDPSFLPFRHIKRSDLVAALHSIEETQVAPILAVTPSSVHLSFFQTISDAENASFGVIDMLIRWQGSSDENIARLLPKNRPAVDPSDEIRLLRTRGRDWIHTLCRGDSISSEVISHLDTWLKTIDGRSFEWLWSIHRRMDVNGDGNSEDIAEWFLFLDAGTRLTIGEWKASHQRLPVLALVRQRGGFTWELWRLGHGRIQPAAITSFSTKTSRFASRCLPVANTEPTIQAVELYAFMQPDCQTLRAKQFAARHNLTFKTVVQFMAACADDSLNYVRSEAIDLLLADAPQQFPIVALATFVPLLSLPPKSTGALQGIKALCFVAHCAGEIRRRQAAAGNRPPSKPIVVELVAGSRVTSIRSKDKSNFAATFESDQVAQQNFVTNLSEVVSRTEQLKPSVLWAVELEPGPLFTVRDWQSLCQICELIDRYSIMRDCVGVNLDVGHWRMSASSPSSGNMPLTPDDVRDSSVFRRIIHAHISGHCPKAHFGDIGLSVLDSHEDFLPWLALLRQRAALTDEAMPYSGFISLELEACKTPMIARSEMHELALIVTRQH